MNLEQCMIYARNVVPVLSATEIVLPILAITLYLGTINKRPTHVSSITCTYASSNAPIPVCPGGTASMIRRMTRQSSSPSSERIEVDWVVSCVVYAILCAADRQGGKGWKVDERLQEVACFECARIKEVSGARVCGGRT
jgi:hypothetical protein